MTQQLELLTSSAIPIHLRTHVRVFYEEDTCVCWTRELLHTDHDELCMLIQHSYSLYYVISALSLEVLSVLTVNTANNQLVCLLGPALYRCCIGPCDWLWRRGETGSLGRISSWHVTLTFPLERGEACVVLSFSLFIPKRGYAVAEFRRRVMFTCSGLCRLYPFCSFLLIKALKSPVPFRRVQRLSLCFFILYERDSPLEIQCH